MSDPDIQAATAETSTTARLELGARLKAAREARGMTPRDVAQQLRLDVHVIEALEADDPERLPARTFVRGYLRNYARLVGLDEALVGEAMQEAEPTPADALKRRPGYRGPAGPALGRWLGYLFLIAVLAALVLFAYPALNRLWDGWQQPATDDAANLRLPAQPLDRGVGDDLEPIWPLPGSAAQEDETAVAPTGPDAMVDEVPAPDTPVRDAEPVSEPAPEPAATTPAPRLVLHFREESWVEIHDRDGRLLYGLMTPGRREQLSGSPPFRLVLGNAAGVELEYDGKRIDTSAHARGAVARLRLE